MPWTQTTISTKDAAGTTRTLLAYTDGTNLSIGNTIFDSAGNILGAQGHGTAATALRVELSTDGTGVVGLNAGANVIGGVHTNATRNAGILHRSAIATADHLATVGTITLSGQASGSLTSGTTYYVTAAAYNRWGVASPGTIVSTSPGGSNGTMRAAFAAVSGADGYDIFLSTASTGPLWVGRITEAQRGTGIVLTAVGVTGAGGTAGAVDIQVVGTGLASNVPPFTYNNAYTPASSTPINCAGYSRAHVLVKMAVTDLRSLPTLNIVPFLANQVSNTDWHQGQIQTVSLLTGQGQSLEQDFTLDVDGSTDLVILIDTITGQGAACSVWVELC